jgi:two-component system, chemotaxis family, sensor kinase CheA
VVDQVLGEQDVVVKPLGRTLAGVRGIAGVTDLGNRRTVLVVDLGAVIGEVMGGEGPNTSASRSDPTRAGRVSDPRGL